MKHQDIVIGLVIGLLVGTGAVYIFQQPQIEGYKDKIDAFQIQTQDLQNEKNQLEDDYNTLKEQYENISARSKYTIFSAPTDSIYFIPTGNIYDDSTLYAFYAYKENPQIITPPTQNPAISTYLDEDGKPLFTGDIVTFGGRYANRMVSYYEDSGIAKVGYGNNETHHLFINISDDSHLYAVDLSTYNESEKDYFVFQIYKDGDRYVMSEWGISAQGTYAGGICFIDIILPNIESLTTQYYIFSWTDLNDDNMPQPGEIALETTDS